LSTPLQPFLAVAVKFLCDDKHRLLKLSILNYLFYPCSSLLFNCWLCK